MRDSAGLLPDFAEFHGTRLSLRAGTYYSSPVGRAKAPEGIVPMSDSAVLSRILDRIGAADSGAMRRAAARQMTLTKPPGSLGRLEDIAVRLAGMFGAERPAIRSKAVILAAGDHGVVAQGVTGYPQAVTAQMVLNFLAGGAAISILARLGGVRQVVVDAGVAAALPDHPN